MYVWIHKKLYSIVELYEKRSVKNFYDVSTNSTEPLPQNDLKSDSFN